MKNDGPGGGGIKYIDDGDTRAERHKEKHLKREQIKTQTKLIAPHGTQYIDIGYE